MHRAPRNATRLLLLALVLTLLLAGCGQNGDADDADSADSVLEGPAVGYFCDGETVVPVRLDAKADDALGTLEALFEGPTPVAKAANYTTAIPAGAKVLGVEVDGDTATVDVSTEFGSGGGSTSMQLRVAQVVFTLTRDPGVKQVVFTMNGKPIDALGGEGLSLSEPQTRSDWEKASPAILIEVPVLGDTVSSPVHVEGTAFVPSGLFSVSFTGTDGLTVATDKVKVEGSGTARASFDSTLSLDPGSGSLVPWYVSAEGGKLAYPMRVPVVVE